MRKIGLCILWLAGCLCASPEAAVIAPATVADLRTEYQVNPLGLDTASPRLSWQLRSSARGTLQFAYQIRAAMSEGAFMNGKDLIWDSGKVPSGESTQVAYAGSPLLSRQRYYWQVRVWNEQGNVSTWSAPAWWEMGLLTPSDWTAKWIAPSPLPGQAPLLRRAFTLSKEIAQARAYVTSHGLYQLFLNGRRVGDAELTPGFTSYNKRLMYQTYDISGLLKKGDNALGSMLGEGWYCGPYGWVEQRNLYGERTALLMQLEVEYTDGTSARIVTDGEWKSSPGPILMSEIYDGETYDARLEQPGWDAAGFDDVKWQATKVVNASKDVLIAQSGPSVRKIEQIEPQRILRTPAGETIVDMGQNMVGWVRLSVEGPAGTTVTLRHGEALDAKGNLYTTNLGFTPQLFAQQTIRYVLKGRGTEIFEPHFTYQGFRYVAVEGYPGELTPEKVVGIVVSSDMERTGELATSNALLNQLQHNIVWTQKGNFLAIPTDNPERNERLGWTAGAQLFTTTAAFNSDVAGFFTRWLKDLAADQRRDGGVPWVVPDVLHNIEYLAAQKFVKTNGHLMTPPLQPRRSEGVEEGASIAVWGDAATVIPWTLYLAYGDRRVLLDQYGSMSAWVEFQRRRAGEDLIWDGDFQFGDWLDPGSEHRGNFGVTDTDLIATAYFAHSVALLSRTARVLGKRDDADRYVKLFERIGDAFRLRFVAADAKVGTGTQTAYVLALQFGLLPEGQRAAAAKHLAEDLRQRGHLTTGIAGASGLLFALSEHGYLDDAYRLLLREEYPSWLYSVKHGATTIWERWDGIKLDGSYQENPAMNSFNQPDFGAVGEWMYRVIGGIDIDANQPGYKHILIRPRPGGGLTHASASHISPYGVVSSSWRIDSSTFNLAVVVPPNATAAVTLPGARQDEVLEGKDRISKAAGVSAVRQAGSDVMVDLGSGQYVFTYPSRRTPEKSIE